jgi:PIN domain nuclease of toxin-antitoxin system
MRRTTSCRPATAGPLSSVLVLDSHVWVKFVAGASLSKRARRTIERAAGAERGVLIPAISLWEIARLAQDGRLKLRTSSTFQSTRSRVFDTFVAKWTRAPLANRPRAA